jgi:predicted  nucleic acid-binding Zn-ribbon protein
MSADTRTLANIPLKIGLGKAHTGNSLNVNQETITSAFVGATQNIWAQTINPDQFVAQSEFIVSPVLTLDLERIVGFMAYRTKLPASEVSKLTGKINPFTGNVYQTGDFVGHIIPSSFGIGYKPVLRNSSNVILEDADQTNWSYDPFSGILVQENELFPMDGGTITCRIYIGKFLNEKLVNFDNVVISGGGIPQSVIDNLQSQIYGISGGLSALEQQFGGGYATLSLLSQISGALSGAIGTNVSNILILQSQVAALQADISSISTISGAVTLSQINNLQSQLNALSGELDVTDYNLQTLNTNVSNFQSQTNSDFSTVNSNILANTTLIQQISANDSVLSSRITAISSAIDSKTLFLQQQITSNDDDIAQLQADIASITTLSGAVVRSDITNLQTLINTISSSQTSSTVSISAIENAIDTINNTLITISNNQSQFYTDISTNASDIDALEAQILALSGSSASNEFTLTQIQALSGELKGDIGNLQSQISDNDNDIAILRSDLDSLAISGGAVLPSQITNLQSQINGISGIFDAHQQSNILSYSTLNDAITANTALIAGVNDDIVANTNAIAAVGSTVSTHTSNILELYTLVQVLSAGGVGGGVGISGGTGVIGPAEDGTYTDGLFTDFTETTPIGTAIDRINEVLKAIVPFPPPLGNFSFNAGEDGKISYDLTHRADGIYPVFDGKNYNEDISYSVPALIGGIFDGNAVVTGVLADNVGANPDGSYPAKCFANGNSGNLILKVNGNVVHTASLSASGAGNYFNGNGSGFVLEATGQSVFPGTTVGTGIYYRKGTWRLTAADLTQGYHYVQVVHDLGTSNFPTQIWKFMIDAKGADNVFLVTHTLATTGTWGTRTLSGVTYHTSGQFKYDATFNKAYTMTYSKNNITHPTSQNIISTNQNIPPVVVNENDQLVIDEMFNLNVSARILNGSASLSTTVPKTLGRSFTTGSLSVNGLLVDNITTASSNTVENFCVETYRVFNGAGITTNTSYSSGPAGSPFTWSSATNMALAGTHQNGLLFYAGTLRSPKQGANGGNFNTIANGPLNNANYSLMSGILTFYRYFYFGGTYANFTLNISATNTLFGDNTGVGSPSGNTIKVEAMIPGSGTGYGTWYDCRATQSNGGIYGTTYGANPPTNWGISFPGSNTAITKTILLKISADASWTGYISSISISGISQA